MSWGDLTSFVAMGGQGIYVWGAVAAVLLAIVAELLTLAVRDHDNASRGEPHETSEETR